MKFINVRSPDKVCADRAKKAAEEKFDKKLKSLYLKFEKTKNKKFYAEYYFEQKKKVRFEEEMYEYFKENYIPGDDMYRTEEDRKSYGGKFADATQILLDALKEFE
jgi:hypothetical protein